MADDQQHTYPSKYPPGTHWAVDAAWEILDTVKPGVLPDDVRAFLAGQIAGRLMQKVSLVANDTVPLSWSVEAVDSDGDGGIDVTVFSGPGAEHRAREYARWKYGIHQPKVVAA